MPSKESNPAKENSPNDRADKVMSGADPKYKVTGLMIDVAKTCKTIAGFFRKGKDKE